MDNNYKITIKGESHPIKTGDTFHRLTITEFTRHNGKLSANCICTCGNHVENVLVRHLLTGNTKSCGCYNSEIVKNVTTNMDMLLETKVDYIQYGRI